MAEPYGVLASLQKWVVQQYGWTERRVWSWNVKSCAGLNAGGRWQEEALVQGEVCLC